MTSVLYLLAGWCVLGHLLLSHSSAATLLAKAQAKSITKATPTAQPHDDATFLKLPIQWGECLTANGEKKRFKPPTSDLALGATFLRGHKNSVRLSTWTSILRGSPENLPNNAVGVSVVPHLVDATGATYPFLPRIGERLATKSPDAYSPACTPSALPAVDPKLYPTMLLSARGPSEREALRAFLETDPSVTLLDTPLGEQKDFALDIGEKGEVKANFGGRPIRTLEDLLRPIFAVGRMSFLDGWTGNSVRIALSGSNVIRSFDYPPAQHSKTASDVPGGIRGTVVVNLPDTFAGRDMTGRLALDNCDEPKRMDSDTQLYVAHNCHPARTLTIRGFRPMQLFGRTEDLEKDQNRLTAIAKVQIGEGWPARFYYDGQEVSAGTVSSIDLPHREVGQPVRLRVASDSPNQCDISTIFTLDQIFEGSPSRLEPPCAQTKLSWPPRWAAPEIGGCLGSLGSEPAGSECVYLRKAPEARLSWGPGWRPVELSAEELSKGDVDVGTRLAALWPFVTADPSFSPWGNDDRGPHYLPRDLTYCYSEDDCCGSAQPIQGSAQESYALPTLAEVRCAQNKSLPSEARMTIVQATSPPIFPFREQVRIKWSLTDPSISTGFLLRERFIEEIEQRWPVRFPSWPALPSSHNSRIVLFASRDACSKGSKDIGYMPFVKDDVERLTARVGVWAKLVTGNESLTDCAQALLDTSSSEPFVTFSFQATHLLGKRNILVIAPSVGLGEGRRGRDIRNALYRWLKGVKDSKQAIPLTILFVTNDGRVETLVQTEDLPKLPDLGDDSIRSRVDRMTFGGRDYQTLRDLDAVDQALQGKPVHMILYLTDSSSLTSGSSLRGAAFGVPLSWKNQGIRFTVAAVGECAAWETMAKAQCVRLPPNRVLSEDEWLNLLDRLKSTEE